MKFEDLLDTIFLGDCMELLGMIPDGSIDLVVSSPPYNLGKEYEKRKELDKYLDQQARVLQECVRVLSSSGSMFWQVGAFADKGILIPLDVRFFPILEDLGLRPRNRIMWVRQHGLHATNKFSARHETILWFTKSNDYKFFLDPVRVPQKYRNKRHYRGEKRGELSGHLLGKNPGDVWAFRNVKHNHEEQTIHPCQFPESMIARMVLATTERGDLVLDPYMGTGTVAVVARDQERHFVGAEIEPNYYKVAVRRLKGTPDEHNKFPNLKTLRDYVEQTGEPIERFRFDLQKGRTATARGQAKIFPEEHHLEELERRLDFEERSFYAGINGEEPPKDYFEQGQPERSERSPPQPRLFRE